MFYVSLFFTRLQYFQFDKYSKEKVFPNENIANTSLFVNCDLDLFIYIL